MVQGRTIDVQDFITAHTDHKLSSFQLRTLVMCFLIAATVGYSNGREYYGDLRLLSGERLLAMQLVGMAVAAVGVAIVNRK